MILCHPRVQFQQFASPVPGPGQQAGRVADEHSAQGNANGDDADQQQAGRAQRGRYRTAHGLTSTSISTRGAT